MRDAACGAHLSLRVGREGHGDRGDRRQRRAMGLFRCAESTSGLEVRVAAHSARWSLQLAGARA